ncbi:MAG: hypothetical protein ACP5XB_32335 [Isosphaeraceae bacterium]
MQISRLLRSSMVLAGLGFFAVSLVPGCGEENQTGTQVKTDPKADADRAKKIAEMYGKNPPGKSQQGNGASAPSPGANK